MVDGASAAFCPALSCKPFINQHHDLCWWNWELGLGNTDLAVDVDVDVDEGNG